MGSTKKFVKFKETIEQTSFTPPIPIKATPTTIASNSNDASTTSVSETSAVMMMSSSQRREYLRKRVSYLTKTHLRARSLP